MAPRALVVVVLPLAFVSACSRTGLFPDEATTSAPLEDAATLESADAAPVACSPGTFALVTAVPSIMFVLDRSGSMSDVFSQGETRWEVLTSALASALPSVNATMEIGALLFPSSGTGVRNDMSCTVPTTADLAPATDHVQPLLTLLEQTSPGGGTPTDGALDVAAGLLLGTRAATTARAMVLATDGAPNCNASLDPQTCTCGQGNQGNGGNQGCDGDALQCLDDARTVSTIGSYAAQGLPTYVVGIQNGTDSEFTSVLDSMAIAGGRPQTGAATSYYAASSADELDGAFVAIRNQVAACTFLSTSVPSSDGSITVTFGGTVVPYDPSETNGWYWGSKANGQIVLTGSACAQATANPKAAITVQVGCGENDASPGDGSDDSGGDATGD